LFRYPTNEESAEGLKNSNRPRKDDFQKHRNSIKNLVNPKVQGTRCRGGKLPLISDSIPPGKRELRSLWGGGGTGGAQK